MRAQDSIPQLPALFENDGDIDVLVNFRPSLYRNDGGNRKNWIGFHLVGTTSNRDAIGARVEIEAGGRMQVWLALIRDREEFRWASSQRKSSLSLISRS
jgi:hypothetical protein